MMRISWCLLICGCLWLGLVAAQAQPPMSSPWNDHPSHRWLPPPKDKNSIADQIGMLERLSQLAGGGQTDQPPTPQLTPEQMQMLDSVVESFRNDKGELELPNLDSVPKSWIDSLLPDPKQRQQAKRLLEEYARERKLPLPGSDPNLPTAPTRQPYNQLDSNPFGNAQADNPDNNRLRPNQSGANQSRNDQPGAGQPGNSPLGSNQPNNRGRTGVNPPGARTPADSSAAEKPSSDRTLNGGPFDNQPRSPSTMPKEVMDLIERLKQVDRAQQQQQSDRASQAATGPRGSSSSRASGNSNTRSPARNTPSTRAGSNNSNNNNRSGLRDPQTNTNNPNNWRPTRPPIPQPNPSGLPNQFPNPNLFNPNQNVGPNADAPITNPFDPSTSPSPTDAQNANELLFDNSLSAPVQNNAIGQPNEVPARNQPQEPLRSAAPRSAPKPFRATELSKQPAATPAATEQPFDVEKSLAQSGMARTLRRIVEKTLKEENAKASTGRQGSEVGNAGGLNSPGSDKANPGAGQSASNSSWWSEALKSWQKPDNGATTNSSAANGSDRNGPFSPTSQEPTSTSAAANAVSNSISSVSRSLRSNQSGEWGRFM
ncbi:MAG: hypothetical protein IT423_03695, partial [Pirellulaceae bacterium]|nr:hypothetical protein [Pirellulaceae bacterium]